MLPLSVVYPAESSSALFRPGPGGDRTYRYTLSRRWDDRAPLVVLMLNPSTADADVLDPTVSRCCIRARHEGYGGLLVTNLFAWRATDPDELVSAEADTHDIVGPENDAAIRAAAYLAAAGGRMLLAGWGSPSKPALRRLVDWRMDTVVPLVRGSVKLGCLGTAKNGWPRHPLYVRGSTPVTEWSYKL